ncbi:MAG: PQQ-binding-like beta-propeller repeat protein [Candidatus Eremiobacteraeota bacterium]|nr:PQQ-binding-like beta-propeller repeat protein [Candidatus Eremiobacteraeota bacterium]
MKKVFYILSFLLLMTFLIYSCAGGREISVFYTGGLCGRIYCAAAEKLPTGNKAGDYVSMSAGLKKILPASEDFLLVDGGNTLIGEDWGLFRKAGRPMLRLMAEFPYSAMLLGEKELSLGRDSLEKLPDSIPLLSSFCKDDKGRNCKFISPPVIKEIGGMKIALLGVFLPPESRELPGTPMRFKGLSFDVDWGKLNGEIKSLKSDYVILLLRADSLDVLKNLEGVDLVIPYRYHSSLPIDKIAEIGDVKVAPVVDSRFTIGEIILHRKSIGGITPSVRLHKVEVGGNEVPEKVREVLEEAGYSRKPSPLQVENAFLAYGVKGMKMELGTQKITEHPTTSYITDLMCDSTGAQIALLNSLSMRQDLSGVVRIDELGIILPYWNELVTMDLTGVQIADLLKENVYEERSYLSVSGLFLGYRPQSESSLKIYYNGNPLNPEKTYRVVTNDYLAKGGRGKRLVFTQGKNIKYTGLVINYLLLDKLRGFRLVTPPPYRTWNKKTSPFETARRLLPSALKELSHGGKREKAIDDLALAVSIGLKNEEFLSNFKRAVDNKTYNLVVGRAHYLRGNYRPALDRYLIAGKMDADDYLPLVYKGELYAKLGYWFRAQDAFAGAVRLNSRSDRALFGLGLASLNLRDLDRSIESFKKTLEISPGDLSSIMLLGLALFESGDTSSASKIWHRAKSMGSGDRNLLKLLALFETPEKTGDSACRLADTPWAKFRGDNRNTGRARHSGPKRGVLKWRFAAHHNVMASPAIGENGIIYVGSVDRFFYAIRPDGTLAWDYRAGDSLLSSPAIARDGTIFVGSNDKSLYALKPPGKASWIYVTGGAVKSSPAIADDGTVIFGSDDGSLYAISPHGAFKWKYQTGQEIFSSPAISPNGIIYIGSKNGGLYAIGPEGKLEWVYMTENRILSSPAIGDDGTVYVGSDDQNLYAISKDGKLKWKYKTGKLPASPAIAHDGTIYIGSDDFCLYAISKEGRLCWKFKAGADIFSSVAVDPDGNIYFGGEDNTVYSLTADGKLRWKFQTLDYLESSPAISSDGILYIGCEDKHIYAIGP